MAVEIPVVPMLSEDSRKKFCNGASAIRTGPWGHSAIQDPPPGQSIAAKLEVLSRQLN